MYGTELATEAYRLLMEVLGTAATLRTNSPGAMLRGRIERMHRSCLILTFGGGTNEIQRDIIGMVALGLPGQSVRESRDFTWIFQRQKPPTIWAAWPAPSSIGLHRRHQRELDELDQRFDRDLWGKLIEADILSTAAPESLGGGGFGVLEQVAVLEALGRQLAAVPYLESVVLGAGALAKFGSEALQQEWATPAVNGEKIIAVALDGEMGEGPVQAQTSGSGYRLTGSRTQVPYGPVADAFLVPAETDSGTTVFLFGKDDAGVTVTSLDTTGHGSVAHLELHGVETDQIVGGDEVIGWPRTTALWPERISARRARSRVGAHRTIRP